MITDPNLTAYIHSLEPDETGILAKIRASALENDVPIIRREAEGLIRVILELNKPGNILEIGTAIAYSAIFFALNTSDSCKITTIENYEPRIQEARENIRKAQLEERITLLEGDAHQILKQLEESYDFIFLDAAKAQYITMLPDILRLMRPGSILLADNVLQEGQIAYSRYILPRRQRTIHERMREFLYKVKHTKVLETAVLSVGDGMTLSVMKGKADE